MILSLLLEIKYIVTMLKPSLVACPSPLTTNPHRLISVLEAPRITQKLVSHHTLTLAQPWM